MLVMLVKNSHSLGVSQLLWKFKNFSSRHSNLKVSQATHSYHHTALHSRMEYYQVFYVWHVIYECMRIFDTVAVIASKVFLFHSHHHRRHYFLSLSSSFLLQFALLVPGHSFF